MSLEPTVDLGEDLVHSEHEEALPTVGLGRPLPYTRSRLIGRGGSSEVFEAFDPVLRRVVAVKLLALPTDRTRFLREARIMAQLEHPHIVPVHDFGVTPDDTAWISMALVRGDTMDAWGRGLGERRLTREGLLDVLDVMDKVCDAVAYAHARGVLHLDLKPTNVMIGDFGRVMLMDWGISRVTVGDMPSAPGADGRLYGTPGYFAAEQVNRPEAVDARTDVFGLGGLLYAVLAQAPPHQGASSAEILSAASDGRVTPLGEHLGDAIPPELDHLVMSALSADMDERPSSARDFQAALRRLRRSTWSLPTRRIPAGAHIVTAGERGEEAYVIAAGTCEVRDSEGTVVRTLSDGDVFGELAVLSGAPRSMDVVAVTEVELHVVGRQALSSGMGLGTWAGRFARALARRFQELEARGS